MDRKNLAKEFSELLDKDTDLTMFTIQDLTLVKTGQQVVMAIVLKRKVATELLTTYGNSLLYFLNTPLCVRVNCNVSWQLTFTQLGVKINSKQKWS